MDAHTYSKTKLCFDLNMSKLIMRHSRYMSFIFFYCFFFDIHTGGIEKKKKIESNWAEKLKFIAY